MNAAKSRIDYINLKNKLNFVNRPLFEFCGAFVNFIDSCYGLDANDPKIKELTSKQLLYTEIMNTIDMELSPFVKKEIQAFSFSNVLQSVVKAFIFDFKELNTFEGFLKKYDSFSHAELFNFIGGCFINEHSQSNCEDWNTVLDSMEKMKSYISEIPEVDSELKDEILTLYTFPDETKMRIRHIICSVYNAFKPYESAAVEQAKKQQKRYANLMEIDYDYFTQILGFYDITHALRENSRIDLCISYMYPVCYFCKENSDNTAFLLNGFLCDEYYAVKAEQRSIDNFLKIIGDETCLKILSCYAQRPHYLQELSRELNIMPATLRMYNKRFVDADLIGYEYKGKRRHYYFNKEAGRRYIEMCSKRLNL